MGRIGQKKPETNIFKCLWYKVQLFGVTLGNRGFFCLGKGGVLRHTPHVVLIEKNRKNKISQKQITLLEKLTGMEMNTKK